VFGAFDVVVAHLAFDDAWVGAWPSWWEEFEEQFLGGLFMGGVEGCWGKSRGVTRLCGGRRAGCG
jgi:hypothetical protein